MAHECCRMKCNCTCRQALHVGELLIRVGCLEVVLDRVKHRHLHACIGTDVNCAYARLVSSTPRGDQHAGTNDCATIC